MVNCPYATNRHLGRVVLGCQPFPSYLGQHERGIMQYALFGGVMVVLGLLWAILALHDDPLREGIRQAESWSKSQNRLRKVLPK